MQGHWTWFFVSQKKDDLALPSSPVSITVEGRDSLTEVLCYVQVLVWSRLFATWTPTPQCKWRRHYRKRTSPPSPLFRIVLSFSKQRPEFVDFWCGSNADIQPGKDEPASDITEFEIFKSPIRIRELGRWGWRCLEGRIGKGWTRVHSCSAPVGNNSSFWKWLRAPIDLYVTVSELLRENFLLVRFK